MPFNRAVRLYETKTFEELLAMNLQLSEDPSSKQPPLYKWSIYNKSAFLKMQDITRAIDWHMRDKREEEGRPVLESGYSGRNSNRR